MVFRIFITKFKRKAVFCKIIWGYPFQVKYAPKVSISIIEGALDTGRIPVDNAIRLKCNADAHPNHLTYQWYINDEMRIGATLSELVTTHPSIQVHKIDSQTKRTKKMKCKGT